MTTLIISGIACGIVCSILANEKGRNVIFWFFVGFFLQLLGIIVVLFMPMGVKAGVTQKCPRCAEIIKAEATVCRYCGTAQS